jgi:hypothetical protein
VQPKSTPSTNKLALGSLSALTALALIVCKLAKKR